MDFKNSQTKDNLMRAFAGESQARNRYTFAGGLAAKAGCADLGAQQQRDKVKAVRCKGELLPGEANIVSGNNLRLQR